MRGRLPLRISIGLNGEAVRPVPTRLHSIRSYLLGFIHYVPLVRQDGNPRRRAGAGVDCGRKNPGSTEHAR